MRAQIREEDIDPRLLKIVRECNLISEPPNEGIHLLVEEYADPEFPVVFVSLVDERPHWLTRRPRRNVKQLFVAGMPLIRQLAADFNGFIADVDSQREAEE